VTSIGGSAFRSCKFSGQPYFGTSLATIGSQAFHYMTFTTPTFVIPDHIRNIKDWAFDSTTFGGGAIILGNGLTNISDRAFNQCRGVTQISAPSTGVHFGGYAFYTQAADWKAIYFRGDYPSAVGGGLLNGSPAVTSYVAQASVDDWEQATKLDIKGGSATWMGRPIRVGEWSDAPGVAHLDPNGGFGGTRSILIRSGQPLPDGLLPPKREGFTFLGYWDPAGAKNYLDADMTPLLNWDLPSGAKLIAHWQDTDPGASIQGITFITLDVYSSDGFQPLNDDENASATIVELSWPRDQVKSFAAQEDFTYVVRYTPDLTVPFQTFDERTPPRGVEFLRIPDRLHRHVIRFTLPPGTNRSFFSVFAEKE